MPDTVKLLQIGKHFHPDTGGIETVTLTLAAHLPAHGIVTDVLCTGTGASDPDFAPPYGVFRCAPGLRFGGNKSVSLDYVRHIRRLRDRYDVALIHMPNPLAAAAVLAFWERPIILLWHADIPQAPIRAACTPLDRALLRKAAAVIAPTPVHIEQSAHAAALAPKQAIIPFPIDRQRLPEATGESPAARRVHAFLGERKLSLSVGRLVPYKGFEILIDAARDFTPGVAAVIAGGGPLHAALAARIEAAGVADRVLLLGSVSDAELADLLQLCDFGCMPSISNAEMYGLAQVDVMAWGKPVIATRLARSGVPFVNRHDVTGLLVEPGDAPALAEAINRLAGDPALYRRLAGGAAASFSTEHDCAVVGGRYAELIRRVAGR